MTNTYDKLRQKQTDEINSFPKAFAYDEDDSSRAVKHGFEKARESMNRTEENTETKKPHKYAGRWL